MSDQIIDMLEAIQRPQVARLQAALAAAQAQVAALRAALLEYRHVRTADDGQPCWCLTEHGHRKHGCEQIRAALKEPTP